MNGNPCVGANANITFGGQSTFVLPIEGETGEFIFMADKWVSSNLPTSTYIWLPLQVKNGQVTIPWYDPWDLSIFSTTLGVKSSTDMAPQGYLLSQNYPNPFNPSTDIKVSLSRAGVISLTIYNVLGQVVQVVDHGFKPAGKYIYNVNMDRFATGVYFCTLHQGNNSTGTKKMLLLK